MADIGLYPHEIGIEQALEIDINLTLLAVPGDCLSQSVDYVKVAQFAEQLGKQRIELIEIFATKLSIEYLSWNNVAKVTINVRKPDALANGIAEVSVSKSNVYID